MLKMNFLGLLLAIHAAKSWKCINWASWAYFWLICAARDWKWSTWATVQHFVRPMSQMQGIDFSLYFTGMWLLWLSLIFLKSPMKTHSCLRKFVKTQANPLLAMRLLVLFVHKYPEVLYLRVCEHRMCGKSQWAHGFFVRICRKVSYCTANAVLDKQKI